MSKWDRINLTALTLGIVALFMERASPSPALAASLHVLDFGILALLYWSEVGEIRQSSYRWNYARKHWPSLAFLAGFTALFLYSKYMSIMVRTPSEIGWLAPAIRNIFLVLKVFGRFKKLYVLFERLSSKPAQTVIVSFMLVILAGALVLMVPPASTNGKGLSFVEALFTATSAVCVTGLVVVDTAVDFSLLGQATILLLIQIGGLGIMLFSFFVMIALRKRLSLKDRLTVSYMLSEDDMTGLSRSLRTIVLATLGIEGAGALLLFVRFTALGYGAGKASFYAAFHSVSAFCNAGFALYSDSLESFSRDPWILLVVAALITLGGISFGVMRDLRSWLGQTASGFFFRVRRGSGWKTRPRAKTMSQNTFAVATVSGALVLAGFCGVYLLEHEGAMSGMGLGEQYLGALFQSVTLRTAGFNSISFGGLKDATLFFMIFFMFTGGASGSTAGGIKVNSLAAIGSYLRSFLRQEKNTRIGNFSVSGDKVGKAFLILIFGLAAVFGGSLLLSLTEDRPFLQLLFEATSAFGTVGLSAGITPGLSTPGRLLVIMLMFMGRLGPLTILTAASKGTPRGALEYPQGDLAIG